MLTAVSCLLLAAAPAKELKIAAPGLAMTGVDAALSAPLTDQLLQPFAPIGVITPRDVAAIVGLDRQKELLGCTGAGQCLVELGNALGVQGVLLGDVVKLGGTYQVNARIIEPLQGKLVAQASQRVTREDELFDALTRVGLDLREQFYRANGVTEPPPAPVTLTATTPPPPSASGTGRRLPFVLLGLGGAVTIAGGILVAVSESSYIRLTSAGQQTVAVSDARVIAESGKAMQTASWVLLGVGAALLVAGLVWLLVGRGS